MSVYLKIDKCKDCPHLITVAVYTADSWERPEDWLCGAAGNKKIAGYVEWERDEPKEIPEWCPLRNPI